MAIQGNWITGFEALRYAMPMRPIN
jgi:hypothetical protein